MRPPQLADEFKRVLRLNAASFTSKDDDPIAVAHARLSVMPAVLRQYLEADKKLKKKDAYLRVAQAWTAAEAQGEYGMVALSYFVLKIAAYNCGLSVVVTVSLIFLRSYYGSYF